MTPFQSHTQSDHTSFSEAYMTSIATSCSAEITGAQDLGFSVEWAEIS